MSGSTNEYLPVVDVTRGSVVESVHFGAAAVMDSAGTLLASIGSPELITFMRSSAKPFQALPFIESGAWEALDVPRAELAIVCASHSGTDRHLEVVQSLQQRAGIVEDDLQCGTHPPLDLDTAQQIQRSGLDLTPNRHNCSGKHSAMLATALHIGQPRATYLQPEQPLQQQILEALCSMVAMDEGDIEIGTDGCSAPNFALPLINAAYGYARLADPAGFPEQRQSACSAIFEAMTSNPFLVAGPGRFDTTMMEATGGSILSKGGAEGYYAVSLAPGRIGERGVGIAVKIADGDRGYRGGATLVVHILERLGALTESEYESLSAYQTRSILNHRNLPVGMIRPCCSLEMKP
jgi:L-asparaginase II